MPIETLNELNAQSCCCDLTLCPIPAIETRAACGYVAGAADVFSTYFSYNYSTDGTPPPAVDGHKYKTVTVTKTASFSFESDTLEESGSATYQRVFTMALDEAGDCVAGVTGSASWSTSATELYPDGPPESGRYALGSSETGSCGTALDSCGGTQVATFSEAPTSVSSPTGGLDIGLEFDPAPTSAWTGSSWTKTFANGTVSIGYSEPAGESFRMRIPATWVDPITADSVPFPGTYCLLTYDIIDEPDGWDDPSPTVFRTMFLEDQTMVWNGPGSGAADDATWATDWVEIAPSETGSGRRVVNKRIVCRENWFLGVAPQVWGEAVTLPDA